MGWTPLPSSPSLLVDPTVIPSQSGSGPVVQHLEVLELCFKGPKQLAPKGTQILHLQIRPQGGGPILYGLRPIDHPPRTRCLDGLLAASSGHVAVLQPAQSRRDAVHIYIDTCRFIIIYIRVL